jgi:hypothetical protein
MNEPYSFTGISNKQLEEVKHHMRSGPVLRAGLDAAQGSDSIESLANQVIAMIEAMKSPEEHLSSVKLDGLTVLQLKELAEKHRVRIPTDCRRRADIIAHLRSKGLRRDRASASKNANEMYSAYHV